jgi:hypothetical protein
MLVVEIPHFGANSYIAQCPEQFRVVVKAKDGQCSGLVVTLLRKPTALQGLLQSGSSAASMLDGSHSSTLLEEPDDMDWARAVLASRPKLRLPDKSTPSFSMLSLACILLPPPLPSTPGDPMRRSQLLGAALERSPYDLICLQECFWTSARQALRASLVKGFPHIADRAGKEAYGVGVGSGLLVASKHPILWSQFYPFEEGVGSDSLASKGEISLYDAIKIYFVELFL